MEAEASVMFQGVARESAAFRLMRQMGWEEGNGLGKDLQGMKSHIKVSKKSDTSGIGLDAKAKAQANWALNTHAYDAILKNLKVQGAVIAPKGDGDDSSSSDDEDVPSRNIANVIEEVKPKKVARPQGRYKKREQGKLVGTYSETDLAAILGAVVGKTETESFKKELTSLEVTKVGKTKTESFKKELTTLGATKVGETETESCKKELTSFEVTKVVNVALAAKAPFQLSREASPVPVSKTPSKKRKKKSDAKVVDSSNKENDSDESACTPLPALPADWWGNKYGFVRAGHLGATRDPPKVRTEGENATLASSKDPSVRTAFREQDQEDLYNLVQDKATTGKKGLGIGDCPRKVGGAHWKGQKKAFDSSSEDESGEDDEDDEEESEAEEISRDDGALGTDGAAEEKSKKRKCDTATAGDRNGPEGQENLEQIKAKKRRKAGNDDTVSENADDILNNVAEDKLNATPNWKKLCKHLLTDAPSQTLSIKRLHKRVLAAGLFPQNAECSMEDRRAHLKAKLLKSSRFVVDGKTVSLSAAKVGA